MLRVSCNLWKKKVPPLGYSKAAFFKKLNNPRASKPWRNRAAASAGRIEVTSNTDVINESGDTVLGSLTTAGPLGMRSPHLPPYAAGDALTSSAALASPCVVAPSALTSGESAAQQTTGDAVVPYGAAAGVARPVLPSRSPSIHRPTPLPSAVLPMGRALDLEVAHHHTYREGPMPLQVEALQRSRREVAESIRLPRHINRLFHKIMGWSEELGELEAAYTDDRGGGDGEPQALRRKAASLADHVKYGVLMDAYNKDQLALAQRLEVAGEKMERKFLTWEGVHVLDQDNSAEMAAVREHKASIVMDTPASFRVPVVNRDCCPGCGALLQDKSEDDFGYVAAGEVERYVAERQHKVQARHEYATRMAELQSHWATHGRRVGEEWLDFMTQEEFDAFYRDRPRPFTCHRCHALEHLGVEGRRKVWSAPDFTEKLQALREKRCVVVLVVDATDFPGSMVYDLPGLISMNNKVIIAVNKMDCVRNRSFTYSGKDRAVAACLVSERYVRRWAQDIAVQFRLPRHQVHDVIPLSAKRGWGVDKLIAAVEDAANLNLRRPGKPLPTYFVGVANVGKSSVINAMAHRLYIPQPPHPKSTKVYFTRTSSDGKEAVFWRWYTPPNVNQAEMLDLPSRRDKKASKLMTVSSLPGTTVSTNAVRLSLVPRADGKAMEDDAESYLYDTPGLLPHWHRHSPLTLLQLRRTLQRKFRNPQCFLLTPGHTLFLGGLAAVDVVKGPVHGLLMMVYTSQKTRNAAVLTGKADFFWREQLGRALDPPGSLEQLHAVAGTTPALSESRSYFFECYGRHRRRPKADIYICGLGWVAFCVSEPADVVLRVRTLPGVVHGVREPLRYNDLRAFRFWPKLKRRFTAKGLADLEDEVDADSINTVVRLTMEPHDASSSNTATEGASAAGVVYKPVSKAVHPRHETSASQPLDTLVEELQSAGKI